MQKRVCFILAGVLGLFVATALADPAPQKSERGMTPNSAKAGHSPNGKSERAMSKDSAKPGSAPNGKSERGMEPSKSAE